MSTKTKDPAVAPAAQGEQSAVEDVKLSLSDYCARLSETVRRPELLGAFEATERRAGRSADLVSAYRSRFDQFIKSPL